MSGVWYRDWTGPRISIVKRLRATPAFTHGDESMNPLKALQNYGQSAWLDFIRRNLIKSGELARLIQEDGLRGVTSNPAIFEKAIAGSTDYTEALGEIEKRKDVEPMALYESLAIKDIQDAADIMKSVYDQTKTRDGYVSLEVSPYLA